MQTIDSHSLKYYLVEAVDLIVHRLRLEDGARKTTRITEVAGMESDVVTLSDIFTFKRTGYAPSGKIEGTLKATGIRPIFSPRLEVAGFRLGGEVFRAY